MWEREREEKITRKWGDEGLKKESFAPLDFSQNGQVNRLYLTIFTCI